MYLYVYVSICLYVAFDAGDARRADGHSIALYCSIVCIKQEQGAYVVKCTLTLLDSPFISRYKSCRVRPSASQSFFDFASLSLPPIDPKGPCPWSTPCVPRFRPCVVASQSVSQSINQSINRRVRLVRRTALSRPRIYLEQR